MSDSRKFRAGQVVMIVRKYSADRYPVKLDHRTRIGEASRGLAWIDSLNNVEYEDEMRRLTKREGGR